MKKLISVLVMAMFMLSILSIAFAKEENVNGKDSTTESANDSASNGGEVSDKPKLKTIQSKGLEIREKFNRAVANYAAAKANYLDAKGKMIEARLKLKSCKDENSTECLDLRAQVNEHSKTFLTSAADKVLAVLEKLKEKITASEDISDEDKAAMLEDIDNSIAKIEDAKSTIDSLNENSTDEEIKAAAEQLREAWNNTAKISAKKGIGRLANEKIHGIVVKSEKLQAKLEKTLAKLAEKGYDTSKAESLLEEFNAKIASANESYQKAREAYTRADTDQAMKEANSYMKEAQKSLQEANKILKELIKEVKGIGKQTKEKTKPTNESDNKENEAEDSTNESENDKEDDQENDAEDSTDEEDTNETESE